MIVQINQLVKFDFEDEDDPEGEDEEGLGEDDEELGF
jgi:hypothetical protein